MKRVWIALLLALALLSLPVAGLSEGVGARLGQPLPDFSVTCVDGSVFSLSEALETRKMVLINLWASWCGPCELEFPYMEQAYEAYADQVAIIALSVEPGDSPEIIADYAQSHGLTFPMGSDEEAGLAERFVTGGIPTTVVVDRFGNVAMIEVGAQPSATAFEALFQFFIADDYTQTVVLDGFPGPERPEPADGAALAAAGNAPGGALAFETPEEAWPMWPETLDGREALASQNAGVDSTAAGVSLTVSAGEGDALAFDVKVSSEMMWDAAFVSVDGVTVKRFSGGGDWTAWAVPLSAGEHSVTLGYRKDDYGSDGEDKAWFDEVRLLSGDAAREALAALPVYPMSDEAAIEILDAEAEEIAFDDPEGVIRASYDVTRFFIVPGSEAHARLRVPAGTDPDSAYVLYGYEGRGAALETLFDGDEFGLSVNMLAGEDDEELFVAPIYFTPNVLDPSSVVGVFLFHDPSEADALVDFLAMYGYQVSWSALEGDGEAADDGEASVAPEGNDDEGDGEATTPEGDDGERVYTVRFVDASGEGVPGCAVNFCTDETCAVVRADDQGVATFTGAPYPYAIHVLTVPEGYDFDRDEAFTADPEGGELVIDLGRRATESDD